MRPETVSRSRLTRALAAGSRCPLTVVSAPAGYGKTTALLEWLATVDLPCAWVSLDARDNDPRRLWAHVLAALDGALPGSVDAAQRALRAGSDLLDTVMPLAWTDLAGSGEELVLVLDDYHVLEEEACHRSLAALVDTAPAGVRVVISGRAEPPLRLARRRAAGSVTELGPEELRFRREEAARLLNGSLGLGLEPDQVRAIDEKVGGWAAGLSLVAASLRARPERGEFLHDLEAARGQLAQYLIEEVLDATPPKLRDFLCRTSILRRLNAPLCEAVVEDRSAGALLDEVRRSNLFVTPLTAGPTPKGEWLVYHDVFRELLERELMQRSPEVIPLLHRRASAWFAANGLSGPAMQHAAAAGDGERAAELLHGRWRQLLIDRRYVTLRQMIAALPAERGAYAGFCEALDTLCMALAGADLRLVAERLDGLEAMREEPGVAEIVDQMRISPYYGDVGRALDAGWTLWERYGGQPAGRAWIAGQFGLVLWFAGQLDEVRRILEPLVGEADRSASRIWNLSTLALTEADDRDGELAESYAREAVDLVVASGAETALESHIAYVALAEALRLVGALEEAADMLERADRVTSKLPGSVYHALTLVFQAQLDLARRDRGQARSRAAAARRIVDSYPDVGTLAQRLARIEAALERRSGDALLGSRPTPAEMRLLELLPTGLTLKEIASEHLYVSIHTVTSHAQRLYRRLGARNRADAVTKARERGLI